MRYFMPMYVGDMKVTILCRSVARCNPSHRTHRTALSCRQHNALPAASLADYVTWRHFLSLQSIYSQKIAMMHHGRALVTAHSSTVNIINKFSFSTLHSCILQTKIAIITSRRFKRLSLYKLLNIAVY